MNRRQYFCEGLTPDIRERAKKELGETEEVQIQSLKELKKIIKNEPDFQPNMDDAFLLRYLRARKFNVQNAFKTLQNYYKYKASYSGIITDFKPSDMKDILDQGQTLVLEYRNYDDVGLGFIRIGQLDLDKFTTDEVLAFGLLCMEIGLMPEVTQVLGYCLIIDLAGFNFYMARKYASPTFLYRFITAIQDCIPCRIKAYHIVNEPRYFSLIYNIGRRFISDKLKKRIHFHGNDMKSLHKHVTPDILPEELSGTYGPISKMTAEYIARINSYEDHFIKINKFGYVGETLQKLRKENSIDTHS